MTDGSNGAAAAVASDPNRLSSSSLKWPANDLKAVASLPGPPGVAAKFKRRGRRVFAAFVASTALHDASLDEALAAANEVAHARVFDLARRPLDYRRRPTCGISEMLPCETRRFCWIATRQTGPTRFKLAVPAGPRRVAAVPWRWARGFQFQQDTTWKQGMKTTSRAASRHTTHFCSPSFGPLGALFLGDLRRIARASSLDVAPDAESRTFAVAAARASFSSASLAESHRAGATSSSLNCSTSGRPARTAGARERLAAGARIHLEAVARRARALLVRAAP